MTEIENLAEELFSSGILRAVLSGPRANTPFRKVNMTKKELSGREVFQFESFTEKQVFHENLSMADAMHKVTQLLTAEFRQLDAWCAGRTLSAKLSKKGKLLVSRKRETAEAAPVLFHNREKSYLLKEGEDIPALRALGVFTPDGRIVKAMYHKYRQINRFVELVDDVAGRRKGSIRVIDFGCGKSYLTFILYYYFTELKGLDAQILGLDLKEDVIERCRKAADEYNYTGLSFEVGDIGGYTPKEKPDMVVSLHACDTATDSALFNAVSWDTEIILSAPCCQHELNSQIESGGLSALTKFGLIRERFSALATDAIRGCLLEACGYSTQLLEFVELEHSPKNILIRAVKSGLSESGRQKALAEAERLMEQFSFRPALYRLLKEKKFI